MKPQAPDPRRSTPAPGIPATTPQLPPSSYPRQYGSEKPLLSLADFRNSARSMELPFFTLRLVCSSCFASSLFPLRVSDVLACCKPRTRRRCVPPTWPHGQWTPFHWTIGRWRTYADIAERVAQFGDVGFPTILQPGVQDGRIPHAPYRIGLGGRLRFVFHAFCCWIRSGPQEWRLETTAT